ncbi:hypothetical protein [Streptomyces mangrovisoli]|uniref:Uncharacterized protein n=1 Tax=Streptomyces mangrovisoli TaxID=1428628 RepID=A0A1J4NUE8_9ACTN|nr:hypothetical protein [Streptomyces mangrovisoli]OIJ65140.1 hypothetical protein WN71_025360 [Streptomyces mangrovisoli]
MRRPFLSFLLLAFGALPVMWGASTAVAASGTASVDCGQAFTELVSCSAYGGTPVTVTLRKPLDYKEPDSEAEKAVVQRRSDLMVQVPSGVRTGQGGTVLLLLAGNRFVADKARIELLSADTVTRLTHDGICGTKAIDCKPFAATAGRTTAEGADLVQDGVAEALDRQVITVPSASASHPAATKTAQNKAGGSAGGRAEDSGSGSTSGILISVIALLVIVLGVLVFLIRRTGGALPHSRHAFAGAGAGGGPAAARTAAMPARGGDEPTAVVRPRPKEPPRSPGRAVGPRRSPSTTAVVRTELHPQGYVEVDRVLYRAVWADPSQPPPPPGGVIDLTEPHDQDDDVFYAFPSEQQPVTGAR